MFNFKIKRTLNILFTFFCIFFFTEVSFGNDYGNWQLSNYVDEFGDDTDDKFLFTETEGVFSNTATQNSKLNVSLVISKLYIDMPYFQFFEYGSNPIIGYYSDGHKYICNMKDSQDRRLTMSLRLRDNSSILLIQSGNKKHFIKWMEEEEIVKFACYEEERSSSKYNFKFDFAGYNEAIVAITY